MLGETFLEFFKLDFEVADLVSVVSLQHLDITFRFTFDLRFVHARREQDVEELTELQVVCWNHPLLVTTRHVCVAGHGVRVSALMLCREEVAFLGIAR